MSNNTTWSTTGKIEIPDNNLQFKLDVMLIEVKELEKRVEKLEKYEKDLLKRVQKSLGVRLKEVEKIS